MSSRATISDLCMPWLEPLDTHRGKGAATSRIRDQRYRSPVQAAFACALTTAWRGKIMQRRTWDGIQGRCTYVRMYVCGPWKGRRRRRLRMLRDNCSENIYASYRSNGTVETVDDPACVNARPRTKTSPVSPLLRSASDGSEFVKRRLVINFNRI